MSTAEIHPLPRAATIAREQFLTATLSLRWVGAAFGVFLILATWVLSDTTGRVSRPVVGPELVMLPVSLLCLVIPLALWRQETPARRSYLFSMPAARRSLHLVRNGAGWLWAMIGTGVFYLWAVVASRVSDAGLAPFDWHWATPIVVGTAIYLLSAAVATASNAPYAWLFGLYVASILLGRTRLAWLLLEGRYGVATLVGGVPDGPLHPSLAQWLLASALWLAVGGATLFAASAIHREH